MTASIEYLPTAIQLPGGLVAKIDLAPMPAPDASGRYQIRQDCDISVSLFRDGEFIDRRPWHTLICGDASVGLAGGATLGEEDLYELDSSGWKEMMKFGLIPSGFIP